MYLVLGGTMSNWRRGNRLAASAKGRSNPLPFRNTGVVFADLFPVAVSLALSAMFIVRSASTLGGRRAYVLFDDAAISMDYARNFANGHGLVWVAGQHPVEGYSNFLWTLWMAVIELAHPSDQMAGFWVMVSGAVLLAVNVYLIARIARRLAPDSRLVPPLAGLAAAVYFGLDSWTLAGMETGLVAFLASTAVLCALRSCDEENSPKRRTALLVACGVLLALAVLTRDDALLVALVVIAFVLVHHRPAFRTVVLIAAPVLVAVVGHLVFRLDYYGYAVPNTYNLKLEGIPLIWRVNRGLVVLAQNATMLLVVPLALAVAYVVLSRLHRRAVARGTWLLLGIVVAESLYLVYIGGDSYDGSYTDRYLGPLTPFLFIVATLGAFELARLARDSLLPLVLGGAVIVVAGVFVWSSALSTRPIQIVPAASWHITSWAVTVLAAGVTVVGVGVAARFGVLSVGAATLGLAVIAMMSVNVVPFDNWSQNGFFDYQLDQYAADTGVALAQSTPRTATVAVIGGGNAPFFDQRPSIDLLGYSDHVVASGKPHQLRWFMPGHDKWDYAYSIGKLRPDVVMGLFDASPADLANMARWGYQSFQEPPYVGIVYFLPGWFDPVRYVKAL
jgi:hypothetical protein